MYFTFVQLMSLLCVYISFRLDILSSLIDFMMELLIISGVTRELYTVLFDAIITYDYQIKSANREEIKVVSMKWNEKKSGLLIELKRLFHNHRWSLTDEVSIHKDLKVHIT